MGGWERGHDHGNNCGINGQSGPLWVRDWQFTLARQGQASSWDTTEPKLGA